MAGTWIVADAMPRRCSVETEACTSGRFLDHWAANGGLARNGYPLGPVRRERLDDGRVYSVQYFERVRLEFHPENSTSYDVLLGQFARGIHPADPPVAVLPGAIYDPATGHNIARPAFAAYYAANGGLAQFATRSARNSSRRWRMASATASSISSAHASNGTRRTRTHSTRPCSASSVGGSIAKWAAPCPRAGRRRY